MFTLPARFAPWIVVFAPLFCQRTWRWAEQLLIGALLAPGVRTVTSVLRVVGLATERQFGKYHRVLSRAVWSSRAASRLLLQLLVRTFAPTGTLVFGLDDTLERRRGARIAAKGVYRDPVRSSDSHFVKATGLRWLSVMLLAPIPWAHRVWALPFLTALAPSERYHSTRGQRHKRLTDWARQLLRQVRRWLPDRRIVVVTDSGFAALELLAALTRDGITMITRLRLDAALYAPAPMRGRGTTGRPRKKGARLPTLAARLIAPHTVWTSATMRGWYGQTDRDIEYATATAVWYHAGRPVVPVRWVLIRDPAGHFAPVALACTDPRQAAAQIVRWFVQRWQVEVTFAETRRHLGVETQRQWSERAIARTTPILLSLFSLVTLLAHQLVDANGTLPLRPCAWYHKASPTFSDALGLVRAQWWRTLRFPTSRLTPDMQKLPPPLIEHLVDTLCYAA
jgi:hypothetical protein